MSRLIETFTDLEQWFEDIGRTAQITFRIKLTPTYLVRIVKQEKHDKAGTMYVQATGDTLQEALERCLEAYMTDGFVDEEHAGHVQHKEEE